MKKRNLIVKLAGILMATSMVISSSSCVSDLRYVVTDENDTKVLHKASGFTDKIECNIKKVKIEASYEKYPEDYAYDVHCDDCFPGK